MDKWLPSVVYQRLKDVAEAQHKKKKQIILEALVRELGLEGIPLNDGEVYGKKEEV